MVPRKPPGNVEKPSFSDAEKAARGVKLRDFEAEIAALKWDHHSRVKWLEKRIDDLQSAIGAAIDAFQEGRRGDAVKILKGALPTPHPSKPTKPGGDAA